MPTSLLVTAAGSATDGGVDLWRDARTSDLGRPSPGSSSCHRRMRS
ncbi:hypothetical protein AB0D42_27215 [Streptomyces sp. NPDC048304]